MVSGNKSLGIIGERILVPKSRYAITAISSTKRVIAPIVETVGDNSFGRRKPSPVTPCIAVVYESARIATPAARTLVIITSRSGSLAKKGFAIATPKSGSSVDRQRFSLILRP